MIKLIFLFLLVGCGGKGFVVGKESLKGKASLEIENGSLSLYESESTTLSWEWGIDGADATCNLYGNDEILLRDIDVSGTLVISPVVTTIYKISCVADDSNLTLKTIEIKVSKKPEFLGKITGVNKIAESPLTYKLLWEIHIKNQNVICELHGGEELLKDGIKTDGKFEISPTKDSEYTLTCRGGDEVTKSMFFVPLLGGGE